MILILVSTRVELHVEISCKDIGLCTYLSSGLSFRFSVISLHVYYTKMGAHTLDEIMKTYSWCM